MIPMEITMLAFCHSADFISALARYVTNVYNELYTTSYWFTSEVRDSGNRLFLGTCESELHLYHFCHSGSEGAEEQMLFLFLCVFFIFIVCAI